MSARQPYIFKTIPPPSDSGKRLVVEGRVQGVGFRPFTYRLAHRYGLKGWVKNETGRVEIYIKGNLESLNEFCKALVIEAPPLAKPRIISNNPVSVDHSDTFTILPSKSQPAAGIHIPPDYYMCDECRAELQDHKNRRYRYPFINCTQCGPRYTLIKRLPYDRPNTTMAGFPLCPACTSEYENPLDRRFHAQPLACPDCGPRLIFKSRDGFFIDEKQQALDACIKALRSGNIVAIKGVGGYHLVCDAQNSEVVKRLRTNKPRPHKPLAVMFPMDNDLAEVHKAVSLDNEHEQLLRDPVRPIVLVRLKPEAVLAKDVAPGLKEIGIMLPYSPLHHLLMEAYKNPLVVTSANISGEPVLTANDAVETRLGHVADAFLHHTRPIERPADDPVYRIIADKPRPLRLGRGAAPLELDLPFNLPYPILAAGGHIKNTITLAWEDRAVVSPHIGDLGTRRSIDVFEKVINDLQALYRVKAQHIICDAHPNYASARWAFKAGPPVTKVCHHHAHASALAGEYPGVQKWLIFAWDGVGYGCDGTLWGGEGLFGNPGEWQRVSTFRPFYLPGGEKAAREPWRSALALCWQANIKCDKFPYDTELLYQAWQKRLNCPETSAIGRIFDAAAALIGVAHTTSYEGQAPMMLETMAGGDIGKPTMLPITKNTRGILESDWTPLLSHLMDDKLDAGQRAANFHSSLAHTLLMQSQAIRDKYGKFTVGLTGGVFQNRLLTEQAITLLNNDGFDVRLAEKIPCNDAGLSFGQIIEASSQINSIWQSPLPLFGGGIG